MRYADINREFTEMVTKYIANGMVINTGTMRSTTSIDLTDGNEIVRIALEKKYDSELHYDYYQIIVGRCPNKKSIVPNRCENAYIFSDELETIERGNRFYRAGFCNASDWFVTRDEIKAYEAKRVSRFRIQMEIEERSEIDISKTAAPVVLNWVRRQYRCKSARLSDIKVIRAKEKGFLVIYKDHRWVLR